MLGIVVTGILYYKENRNEFSRWERTIMLSFRFLAVTLIAFLLLTPLLETIHRTYEDPVIIIAADNSSSVRIGRDSAYYKEEFGKQLAELRDELDKDFAIRDFTFGEEVAEGNSLDFKGSYTDISALFTDLEARFVNRNVGALIIATDGIYNQGRSPLYASADVPYPIYSIALGDTLPNRDMVLNSVLFNRIVYLGNKFPVEINAKALKCNGETMRIRVSGNGWSYTKSLSG